MSQCWKAGKGQSKKQKISPIHRGIFEGQTPHGGGSLLHHSLPTQGSVPPLPATSKGSKCSFYSMAGMEKKPTPVMLHSPLQLPRPHTSHGVGGC